MIQLKTDQIAYIDGAPHEYEYGDTMLNFIDRHLGRGHVPTLCDAPQLEPYGACRVCSVEVALKEDGPRKVMASCHTPLSPGMHIYTESKKVRRLRKNIVELVLTDHPLDCLTCEVNGNCELQTVAAKVGIRDVRYPEGKLVQLVFCNAGFMKTGFFADTPLGLWNANNAVNLGCHLDITHEYVVACCGWPRLVSSVHTHVKSCFC